LRELLADVRNDQHVQLSNVRSKLVRTCQIVLTRTEGGQLHRIDMHHPEPVPTQGRGRGSYKRLAMSGSLLAVPPVADAVHVAPKHEPNIRPRHKLKPVEPEQEAASFEKRQYFGLYASDSVLMLCQRCSNGSKASY